VSRYLARRSGDVAQLLGDIRCHPGLKHSTAGTVHPAMLAFMGWDPARKKFGGIHRTFLTPDGQKAAVDTVRMAYGDAGIVRLGPPGICMGFSEGIETAICAHHLFDMPVWSGISANGLLSAEPPEGVKRVVLFGDNDPNFVGPAAAFEKARRLAAKGYEVRVQIPPIVGQDWADVWATTPRTEVS